MSDVLANLSDEQRKWVTTTGFGDILSFRQMWYAHTLGYNVVSAFNSRNCSLELKAGTIEISDKTVRSVLGLPMGSEIIEPGDNEERVSLWGEQFEGCLVCKVSPMTLSNRIQGNREANTEFKLNFLVLLYNFFIDGNQNMYLNRDVLRYSMDIDHCGKYNWCRLLIEKLRVSHDYWSAVKSRYFTGSLTFLIMVEGTVIDAWTCILNENEILRSDSSPMRLFLNTETTFVFPIYNATHHYIICYNMKKPSWEIIDNRVQTSHFGEMFGDLPFLLHDLFCDWISQYNLPKGDEIKNMLPNVVKFGWQTTDNWMDCGVYVMRHLETYMGSLYTWKAGLRAEDGKTRDLLKKLRMIYCHKILTWNGNKRRAMVMRSVATFTKAKKSAM
ncbi:hypothetical protein DCAR_0415179 [Daucus carota subsp. sativus]|uniref:Ubiquitin-like protease family profile domain-containing protein n=1 Tax=Daucus carota subsp. sativus TaxID=79200 RepID=A0AAF1AXC6_DAUCS|nr:hypothetical protein DCAR_0415179 [Daucus carota subsp. sativus]